MPRKITRKGLVKKLDKLVFEIVKKRDKSCVTCQITEHVTPSHLFSRKAYSTRWDLKNVFLQCWADNFKHSAHDSYPLTKYFLNKYGQKEYDELHRRFVTPRKFKDHDLKELTEQLEKYLKNETDSITPTKQVTIDLNEK